MNERCLAGCNCVFKSCDILQMEGAPGGTEPEWGERKAERPWKGRRVEGTSQLLGVMERGREGACSPDASPSR